MNNRTYLILIIVLSCALLLIGGAFIGTALYLQGRAPAVVAFPTPVPSEGLLQTPAGQSAMPKEGSPAPDFTVQTVEGEPVKLSDFRGRPIMLNFWATWCGPCTAEMKNIESVFQKHTDEEFVILGVNQGEGSTTVKGYAELWKLTFRLVRDQEGEASRLYQVRALPTTIFIDAQGNIHEIHIGGPMSAEFIEKRVDELLGK
jgi:peroxiredoxin